MYVGIVGSRNYPDLAGVERFVYALAEKYPGCVVVSGGAPGVDSQAETSAHEVHLRVRSYRPKHRDRHYEISVVETNKFARRWKDDEGDVVRFATFREAAFFRNQLIVNDIGEVSAFWYQRSSGTRDTLRRAKRKGLTPHIYTPRADPGEPFVPNVAALAWI